MPSRDDKTLDIRPGDVQQFTGFPNPAILLRDVQCAVVRDNRIVSAQGKAGIDPITLKNTTDVRLENNTIEEPMP